MRYPTVAYTAILATLLGCGDITTAASDGDPGSDGAAGAPQGGALGTGPGGSGGQAGGAPGARGGAGGSAGVGSGGTTGVAGGGGGAGGGPTSCLPDVSTGNVSGNPCAGACSIAGFAYYCHVDGYMICVRSAAVVTCPTGP
jgi:hypothetical protein